MFHEPQNHFDRDVERILDRVYRADTRPDIDASAVTMSQQLRRREQGLELQNALAKLRGMREKSQSLWRLKEEVDYLQEQIEQLKTLGRQIATLKQQLFEQEQNE